MRNIFLKYEETFPLETSLRLSLWGMDGTQTQPWLLPNREYRVCVWAYYGQSQVMPRSGNFIYIYLVSQATPDLEYHTYYGHIVKHQLVLQTLLFSYHG